MKIMSEKEEHERISNRLRLYLIQLQSQDLLECDIDIALKSLGNLIYT